MIKTAGTYTGAVTFASAGVTNSPVTVPVTFTVSNNTNQLSASPTSLSFSAQLSAPQSTQSQSVSVTSTVSGVGFSVAAATSSGGNWLTAYAYSCPGCTTGTTSANATVVVDVSVIKTAGTYTGAVTFASAGVTNSPVTVPVTFTVSNNTNQLSASPASLSFSAQLSAPQSTQSQSVSVTSTVSGVGFSVAAATSSGGNWLTAYAYSCPGCTTGTTSANATVVVDVSVIKTAGTYTGAVTFASAGVTNSPVTVPVTFTVSNNTNQLSASPASLSFSAQLSAPQSTQSQSVSVTSHGERGRLQRGGGDEFRRQLAYRVRV